MSWYVKSRKYGAPGCTCDQHSSTARLCDYCLHEDGEIPKAEKKRVGPDSLTITKAKVLHFLKRADGDWDFFRFLLEGHFKK